MSTHDPSTFDAHDFRQLVIAGAGCLEAHADAINALNVFPVPDGDTGINMTLTLRAATSADLPDAASATVGSMSSADRARGAARRSRQQRRHLLPVHEGARERAGGVRAR